MIVPSYVNLEGLTLRGPGGRQAPLRLQLVMRSEDTTLALHAALAERLDSKEKGLQRPPHLREQLSNR